MKIYTFLAVIILLSVPAFAFSVTVPEETLVVPIGTSKEVNISIYSTKSDDVSFSILDSKPWITQSTELMHIEGGSTKTLSIYLTPFLDTATGVYKIGLLTESTKTGEQQSKFMFVRVEKINSVEIDNPKISGNFIPTGYANINVVIKNYKATTVRNLKVSASISSPSTKLIEFDQNIDSLDSGEMKNITYNFTIPKMAKSGLYTFTVKIDSGDEIREKVSTFKVSDNSKFMQTSSQQPLMLGFSRTITVTNIGNFANDTTIKAILSPFEAAFYSGEKPLSITNSEFTWLLGDVNPGETRTLYYRVDYTPLFLFIIVIGFAVWIFLYKVRIIRIKKFILEKKFIEEGEEFTVGIEIANSTGRKIENVTLKDFVPSVFNIKEGEGLKPVKKKTAAGTEITWKLKDVHKNEVRILSYKILPVFGVHGTIRLPQAAVSFMGRKKEVEIKSAFANIGVETENYGESHKFSRKRKE
ncbi:MAG: CARDB domain-containing protein [Candidatus Aenigmatarchaeota archaeon]